MTDATPGTSKILGDFFEKMDSIVTSEKTYSGGQKEGTFYMLLS